MTNFRQTATKVLWTLGLLFMFSFTSNVMAQDGKALFQTHCAACHTIHKDMTGPALKDVDQRWQDPQLLHKWILNSAAVLKTGDKYANELFEKWNKVPMTAFEGVLSTQDVDAILSFIKDEGAKDPNAAKATVEPVKPKEKEAKKSLLYGIITLLLAAVAFGYMLLNKRFKIIANQLEDDPVAYIPFYRRKVFIAVFAIGLTVLAASFIVKGAIGMGVQKDYQPEQPIFYSHKVHAGINQINCMYCHTSTQDGKSATIPSVNVCMNCHKAINEYTGPQLYNAEGEPVDGTAEIQKLYEYAGYTPGEPWDESKAKPIPWVRIHQLPAHVYFNHSQHVMVGNVQCQTCHGPIEEMDEVKQFATLNMGWCINCHRTTEVNFKGNEFYSIYEKYHNQLKKGELDSKKGITVDKIGGLECQKCHY